MSLNEIRELNIQRNQTFLREIGLLSENKTTRIISTSTSTAITNENNNKKRKNKQEKEENNNNNNNNNIRRSSRIASTPQPNYKEDGISINKRSYNSQSIEEHEENNDNYDNDNRVDITVDNIDNEEIKKVKKVSKTKVQIIDSASCRAKDANLHAFQLGIPIELTGKASVMSQANNGSIPKFSKYSGVVQWNNAYFLWVNITPSNLQKKSNDDSYPNEFLENGKMMTWFGGSLMRPDSELVQDLLFCGGYSSSNSETVTTSSETTTAELTTINPRYDRVCLFIRVVGEPYAYFGRVSVFNVNLNVHPIRITWILKDFEHLQKLEHFQEILKLSS